METLKEDEEYNWTVVKLPSLKQSPELERETGERRRGRDILIAIDHGPNSKHAFDWALAHLVRLADTIHLVYAVSSTSLLYHYTAILYSNIICISAHTYMCSVAFLVVYVFG